MRYAIILCAVFVWGCDDELSYPDGSRWQNVSLDPGRGMPKDAREWDRWAAQQTGLPIRDIKNFTATWGGFSVDPTQQAAFIDAGSHVIIFPRTNNATSEFSGTSDATSFTMGGLPESIWPSGERAASVLVYDDAATGGSIGRAVIATDGTITFHIGVVNASSRLDWNPAGWTASGSKGWQGSIIYAK